MLLILNSFPSVGWAILGVIWSQGLERDRHLHRGRRSSCRSASSVPWSRGCARSIPNSRRWASVLFAGARAASFLRLALRRCSRPTSSPAFGSQPASAGRSRSSPSCSAPVRAWASCWSRRNRPRTPQWCSPSAFVIVAIVFLIDRVLLAPAPPPLSRATKEPPREPVEHRPHRTRPNHSSPSIISGKATSSSSCTGIGGNKRNWHDNLPAFGQHFHAVAWDARGYGESDDYEGALVFRDYTRRSCARPRPFRAPRRRISSASPWAGASPWISPEIYPERLITLTLCDTHRGFAPFQRGEEGRVRAP